MIIITLNTVVIPNTVQAGISAGDLAHPIFQFVTWLGDAVMEFLQINIAKGGGLVNAYGQYEIIYSMGNIFANRIAMFDVNFINPNKYERIIEDGYVQIETISVWGAGSCITFGTMQSKYKIPVLESGAEYTLTDSSATYEKTYINGYTKEESKNLSDVDSWGNDAIHVRNVITWTYNGVQYKYADVIDYVGITTGAYGKLYKKATDADLPIISTANELQPTIASWYKGLRIFALVGLLSVLVYVGIRIIISSSGTDKAKYKKMLMDWLVGICILFILHYTMLFIMEISESITSIFESNLGSGSDSIATNFRVAIDDEAMEDDSEFGEYAAYTICWIALVILTIIFTVQYLKRIVYMAFLTIIAPLIALTYPLDKLKDGKAQAFSMWLKEYMFNALLQPIHLLLYTLLIGGVATDFIKNNQIYALVALGFLVPAEKFFRKMFGLESQTSVGTLGAAAGGAMVMNAINKLRGKPPKEGGGAQSKIRTATQGAGTATQGAGTAVQGAGKGVEAGGKAAETGGKAVEGAGKGIEAGGKAIKAGQAIPYVGAVFGAVGTAVEVGGKGVQLAGKGVQAAGKGAQAAGKGMKEAGKGMKETGKNMKNTAKNSPSTSKGSKLAAGSGDAKNTVNNKSKNVTPVANQSFTRGSKAVAEKYIYGKDARKRARRTILGAAGGLAGATIGVAAGVATGDLSNTFTYGIGGAAAGAAGAANFGEKAWSGAKSLGRAETFKKGYMGTEAYNNKQFDKQFFKSDEYKMLEEKYGKDVKTQAQGYLDRGITDSAQMGKMIEKGVTPELYSSYAAANLKDADIISKLQTAGAGGNPISAEEYKQFADAGLRDIDKISDLAKAGIGAEDYKKYENAGISNVNKIKQLQKYGDAEKVSKMYQIAQNFSKDALMEDNAKEKFKKFASNFGASSNDINELWDNLQDFM